MFDDLDKDMDCGVSQLSCLVGEVQVSCGFVACFGLCKAGGFALSAEDHVACSEQKGWVWMCCAAVEEVADRFVGVSVVSAAAVASASSEDLDRRWLLSASSHQLVLSQPRRKLSQLLTT